MTFESDGVKGGEGVLLHVLLLCILVYIDIDRPLDSKTKILYLGEPQLYSSLKTVARLHFAQSNAQALVLQS